MTAALLKDIFPGHCRLIDDIGLPAAERPSPNEYADWAKSTLGSLRPGDNAILRLRRPRPTAAFSPQDSTHPDFERVKELAHARGFEPIERGTGGRLTLFDEQALAITLLWPHETPHAHTLKRYDIFSGMIADALQSLGLDARVGELPNEYCPGKYSINANGTVKLVGIAQRMNRSCVQMGAIIAIAPSEAACAGLAETYNAMGLDFDSKTYGAITDLVNSTYDQLSSHIGQHVVAQFSATKAP
jgi:octanoyl-[GcvH]:protein N-octanoyltransferase